MDEQSASPESGHHTSSIDSSSTEQSASSVSRNPTIPIVVAETQESVLLQSGVYVVLHHWFAKGGVSGVTQTLAVLWLVEPAQQLTNNNKKKV